MGSLLATDADASSAARDCRLLLIEDQAADAQIVRARLAKGPLRPHIHHVTSLAEALAALGAECFDSILLDLGLPDGRGLETVRSVMDAAQGAPVIVLTGDDDHALAAEAVQLGAQDYLVKGQFDGRQLANSIRFAMERKLLLRQLEEARQREDVVRDRFLSHVSHELRTPLSAVMQFVGILYDGIAGPLNDDQKRCLGTVQRNVRQLRQMIASLMDVTRAGADQLSCHGERVALDGLIDSAVEAVRAQAAACAVSLHTDLSEGLPHVVADPVRIGQVLINLLANAIKYSPAGAEVVVEANVTPSGQVMVGVRDRGPGIATADLERVFDRMVQLEPGDGIGRKGLGLGLFLAREIVQRHGGRIWVESELGRGSVFRFTLARDDVGAIVREVAVPGRPLSLLRVVVQSRTATSRAVGLDAVMGELAAMLDDAIVGSSDRIMPSRRRNPEIGIVLGLADCGCAGAAAIEERLRARVEAHPRWGRWGFAITVRSTVFGPEPIDQTVAAVEQTIESFEQAAARGDDPDAGCDHRVLQPISPHIHRATRTAHSVRQERGR